MERIGENARILKERVEKLETTRPGLLGQWFPKGAEDLLTLLNVIEEEAGAVSRLVSKTA